MLMKCTIHEFLLFEDNWKNKTTVNYFKKLMLFQLTLWINNKWTGLQKKTVWCLDIQWNFVCCSGGNLQICSFCMLNISQEIYIRFFSHGQEAFLSQLWDCKLLLSSHSVWQIDPSEWNEWKVSHVDSEYSPHTKSFYNKFLLLPILTYSLLS